MSAIGLIETRGLTAAVEALDSMAKAANIRLVDLKKVGSGLITVIIEGDVADVSAAIEVGRLAPERTGGELISYNVIPRPHSELKKIL
ncbi:carboxysome shell protein [Virgibacillus profundi]|uniref:Carboxysome shell protein n=1 Tax=Virgibacillus profundi TaxID=2024555 RepID=A0A2A2IDU1_9BACI|nr:BMC domain-containing protein [Virgibacillus profundi]PAV29742.1 carboxysome shell protein [Virgibacillus profundi]PXY53914.1 BMC domain-containing protein [Virgibacillus profundi]